MESLFIGEENIETLEPDLCSTERLKTTNSLLIGNRKTESES